MDRKGITVVRPRVIDDLLINPGVGFTTFQRFNGDKLNQGKNWTEGYPIEYQEFKGNLENENHPMTSIAYFRIYWCFIEPQKGEYAWELIDKALETARQRKQTLMLRVAPYGWRDTDPDVPGWYRKLVGEERYFHGSNWIIDHEDPLYAEHFGKLIKTLGERYDGHPDLESVDMAIVGPWGEGEDSEVLTDKTRRFLVDSYIDSFKVTPLIMMLTDRETNKYGLSRANVGYRADCLGDMRDGWDFPADFKEFDPGGWSHMLDLYPRQIIESGMQDAWKTAPVSFEVCWVVQHWMDMGWDIDYIIEQSLKWHISSFNAKSSPIPEEWQPKMEYWQKKMGYRLALRRLTYPKSVSAGDMMEYTSWWENLGVAPCYKNFKFAFRLVNERFSKVFSTNSDIREWLPGDSLSDGYIMIPTDMPKGKYEIQVGIIDSKSETPVVKLVVEGLQSNGWYAMGNIEVK